MIFKIQNAIYPQQNIRSSKTRAVKVSSDEALKPICILNHLRIALSQASNNAIPTRV